MRRFISGAGFPADDLLDDLQRLGGSVGLGEVAGEALVADVEGVFDVPGLDAPALGCPCRCTPQERMMEPRLAVTRHWTLGEVRMPTTRFTVHSSLPPTDVMAVLTDFGPARASRWPNIDEAHFKVHELGPDWAVVTEGTALGWERTRYSWDPRAGTVTIDTLDSNLWGPASGWRYQLRSTAGGTDVQVTLTRVPKSLLGRLVGTLIPIAGPLALRKQFESVLRKAERP